MKKQILKRIISFIVIISIIISINANVNASDTKKVLNAVEKSSETKQLENAQGTISKKIVDIDENNGEVTIELSVTNGQKTEEIVKKVDKKTEIFLIIDESGSMNSKIKNETITRRDVVRSASKTLVNDILNNHENVKIGIIKFESQVKMTSELSNDIDKLNKAIDTYNGGGRTNLYDALVLANDSFSKDKDTNKLVVILTDGLPNEPYGSKDENGNTISVGVLTKQELITVEKSGTAIISMMTEVNKSYESYVERVFGTPDKPTVGKYYYIADSEISNIIKNNIYVDISESIEKLNHEMTNVQAVDYFPEDIMNNFTFSCVDNPNIGTVSDSIDTNTKTITWNIGTIKDEETATLKYKLKLKDMNNEQLLNKVVSTNEKVVLTYKDKEEKDYSVVLESSPKIQLVEKVDESNKPTILPKTGENLSNNSNNNNIYMYILVASLGIVFYIRLNSALKKNK